MPRLVITTGNENGAKQSFNTSALSVGRYFPRGAEDTCKVTSLSNDKDVTTHGVLTTYPAIQGVRPHIGGTFTATAYSVPENHVIALVQVCNEADRTQRVVRFFRVREGAAYRVVRSITPHSGGGGRIILEGPVDEVSLEQVESVLGRKLPPLFRNYVKELPSIRWDVEVQREETEKAVDPKTKKIVVEGEERVIVSAARERDFEF